MAIVNLFKPIGTFECGSVKKYDVPRQASLNPKEGLIHLESQQNFEQALADLKGFSHIWLIYLFDNTSWKPKVQTPRDLIKKGVFATRSPYRPNPIGMSLVELLDINKLTLKVKNFDLLNQTKILDIKPYLDFSDSISNIKQGWLEDLQKFDIKYSDLFYKNLLHYLPDKPSQLIAFIEQQLSYAPINHPNKRVKNDHTNIYVLSYKYLRIHFKLQDSQIFVTDVTKVANQ